MTTPRDIKARLISIAEPLCAASGYELVDVDYESGNAGWIIRFYIDYAPAHVAGLSGGISFADCETVARELGAVLDVEDPVPHAYSLEVSSPGVDRPLRTAEHLRRQVGQVVKLQLGQGLNGRRNFKGRLLSVSPAATEPATAGSTAAEIFVMDVDGERFELPVADIERGRLVPDWDALLKGKSEPKQPRGAGKPKAARPRPQD